MGDAKSGTSVNDFHEIRPPTRQRERGERVRFDGLQGIGKGQILEDPARSLNRKVLLESQSSYHTWLLTSILGAILLLYLTIGAFIFFYLEREPYEHITDVPEHQNETQSAEDLISMHDLSCQSNTSLSSKQESNETQDLLDLESRLREVLEEVTEYQKNMKRYKKWTFMEALMYSFTLTTTIGYGHLYPRDDRGRVATLLYCMMGIPINLSFLAFLGRVWCVHLNVLFAFLLKISSNFMITVLTLGRNHLREDLESSHRKRMVRGIFTKNKQKEAPVSLCLFYVVICLLIGSLLMRYLHENWTFFESFYFCYITLTTIGLGDIVPAPDNWCEEILVILYTILGMSLIAMTIEQCASGFKEKVRSFEKKKQQLAEIRNAKLQNLVMIKKKNQYPSWKPRISKKHSNDSSTHLSSAVSGQSAAKFQFAFKKDGSEVFNVKTDDSDQFKIKNDVVSHRDLDQILSNIENNLNDESSLSVDDKTFETSV